MNGRSGLAEAALAADDAQQLLGPQNYEVILQAAAAAQGAGSVKGEIRGKHLTFRHATLAAASAVAENTIEADERVPAAKLEATPRHCARGAGAGRGFGAGVGTDNLKSPRPRLCRLG